MKNIRLFGSLALVVLLQACGSGGGGVPQLVGQFVDDPVEGLTYQCAGGGAASSSGLTNALGQFNYQSGQACTFSVGKVVVGSLPAVPADGLVTPQDVAGVARTATASPSVMAIAQFLQSLSEPGSNGKIKISASTTQALSSGPEIKLIDTSGPIAQDSLRILVTALGKTLVTPAQAAANLETGITKSGVSKSGGVVTASTPKAINSISVSAPNASQSVLAAGDAIKLSAVANWSDGTGSVVDGTVNWSSSDTTVATVASDGTVTSRKPGTVKISGTNGKFTGSLELSVTEAVLQSLSVPSGLADNLPLGVNRALSLIGTYSDGSQKTLTSGLAWTVDDAGKAGVEQDVLLAKATGEVNVTGAMGSVSKTFKLNVSPAVLRSLVISRTDNISTSTSIAAGRTVQLKALGTYSDGSTQDLSGAVTWSASNDKLAAATGGLVTTRQAGSSAVTVSDSSTQISATVNLTVGAAELASLTITAPSSSLALGLNQTLTLEGTYTDGSKTTSLSEVQWSSSDANKASVASNGLVTAVGQGQVKLTASVGGVSKDVTVTVTEPVAKALTVSSVINSVANGASAVIEAVATLTNNATVSVAKLVNWTIESLGGQAAFAIVGDTVRLTGTAAGDVLVKGEYQGIFANFRMSVTPTLSGVAAVGAPLSGATITLTDSRGTQKTTIADDQGNFSFTDLSGMVAPYQVMAVMNLGDRTVSHYSLVATANGAQTANVTQLTSAMAALLNSNASVLTSLSSEQLAALTPESVNAAKQKILSAIKPLTDKIVTGNFDPVSTPFTANGTGADLLLDHLDLTVRSDKISLSNKMAVTDGNSLTAAIGVVPKSGNPVAIQDDSTTSTSGFEGLQQAFETCFKQAASVRMVASSATSATLDPACDAIATSDYLHNGQNFKLRWARALKFDKFNANTPSLFESRKKTKFLRPEVRLRISSSPEIIAVNIHFNDTDGNNYTSPELIKKMPDGSWKLYGNQRGVNAFTESQLNYYQDLSKAPAGSSYNNINFSRIDSGFRFFVDPRTAFDAQGTADYSYVVDYTSSSGYKPSTSATYAAVRTAALADGKSVFKCVVVTGPGRMVGNKWMGMYPDGIVMKVPFSSPTQDYVAIDRRLNTQEKQALDAINMSLPLSSRTAVPSSICGSNTSNTILYPTTTTSSSNYTVEIQALTNQVHPFTGQVDPGINGRDVKWNTGARYARIAPDSALATEFDNNPVFTYYVIDSNDKLVQKIATRMLGELPPVTLASEIMRNKLSSQMDTATLRRYLDFDAAGADVSNNVTSVNAQWTTEANAFGADLIGFYSEIQKSKTGQGLRSKFGANPQSIYQSSRDEPIGTVVGSNFTNNVWQSYNETTLWESDPDLAVDLDALPGTNFFWRWSEFARSLSSGQTVCNSTSAPSTNTLVTSQSVGVARSTKQLTGAPLSSRYLGISELNGACLNWYGTPGRPADKAYLHREVWMRTYTDKNVRFYSYTANKAFR